MSDSHEPLPSPATVLIVDDDASICAALAALLEAEGHSPQIAQSGPAAIAAIEMIPYRLAILDVNLRDIDGIHIARFVRKRWPSTKIAIFSGASESEVRQRFDDYDAFARKGGSEASFLEMVRLLLNEGSRQPPASPL